MKTISLKSDGFSLLEVVIVLALLMTGFGLGLPAVKHAAVKMEENRFFELVRSDIYFAQSEAYRTASPVSIIFRPEVGRYDIVRNVYHTVSTRKMPDSVNLKKTSNLTEISYWSTGSVLASGTLRFSTSTGEKTLVVHLGKGRVVFSG